MKISLEIKLLEYQTGGYVTVESVGRLINYLTKNHYFGKSLDDEKNTEITLDCSEIIRVKQDALEVLSGFSAATNTKFSFSNAGFLKDRTYNHIVERQSLRKRKLLDKFKKITAEKEELFEKFVYNSKNGDSQLLEIIFTDLFNYDTAYLQRSLRDTNNTQVYLKEAKESKLKSVIQHLCAYKEKNFRKIESILLKILEMSKKLGTFEEKLEYVYSKLNRTWQKSRNILNILSIPFKNDPETTQDLENLMSDTVGLIRFLYDSDEKHEWLVIKEKDAIKSQRVLKKLLEKNGEKIFKEYEQLTNQKRL